MTRTLLVPLVLAGCTADFFVGPEAGSSSGADTSTTEPVDPTTHPSSSSGPETTDGTTTSTNEPTSTTEPAESTASTESTVSTASTASTLGDSSSSSTSDTTGETESQPNCNVETAKLCEAALPTCWWTGEACMENPCDVGGELDCLGEAPDCTWGGDNCIPSGCSEEGECSPLEPAVCEATKGCLVVLEQCYALACVPCHEVDDIETCQELPNCGYDELREACLPQ